MPNLTKIHVAIVISTLWYSSASCQISNFKSPLDTIISGNHFLLNYNGKKVLEGELKNDRREGVWMWYDSNGSIWCEGYYQDGMKEGEWKYFYKNHHPACIIHFHNGHKFGKSVGNDTAGNILSEKFYDANSNLDSLCTNFYANNKVRSVERYEHGNIMDVVAVYDSSGHQVDPGTLRNGSGTRKEYFPDGKLYSVSNYKNSLLSGDYTSYYRTGKIAEKGFYAGDTAAGVWQYFYLNGEPKVSVNYDLDTNKSYRYTDKEADWSQWFQYVEVMPEFTGGITELMKFLQKNLRYPPVARENGLEGRVIVQFVVNEIGEIEDTQILQDVGGGCSEEVLRLMNCMPPWTPGFQNGNPVKVYFKLPVSFKLGRDKEKKKKKG